EMICGGRYLSCDDAMRVFAAGSLTNVMRIEVDWRSGKRSLVNGVRANRIYEVDEAGATADPSSNKPSNLERPTSNTQRPTDGRGSNSQLSTLNSQPFFEDVSQLIRHKHHEEEFNDFERQPLLPKKFSQLGPGVAWHDLDGDGWEDLLIGGGRGGRLGVYRNDGNGRFEPWKEPPFDKVVMRDQT